MRDFARRLTKGIYRRVPLRIRTAFESLISPITRRVFFAGLSWAPPPIPQARPVSIVIPSYNDVHLLRPLLRSIQKTVLHRDFEVIISDDYCQPMNTEILRTLESKNVRLVTGHNRTGFAGAVNRGLAQARWDVVLLNSDMIALPGWLDWLEYCAYEVDPLVGMVSPHLIYPTGRLQYGGTFQNRVAAPQWFSHLFQGRPANYGPAQFRRYTRANCGAAIYVKKNVLEAIGLLDEGYWLGFEDVDWSFRTWTAGFRCMIEPNARLIHLESATRGYNQGPREYASMRRFWRKWNRPAVIRERAKDVTFVGRESSFEAFGFEVGSAASQLSKILDVEARIHVISESTKVDEQFISSLQNSESQLIALDLESVQTVWLSGIGKRTPIVLLNDQDMRSLLAAKAIDFGVVSPELNFVASSVFGQTQLSKKIPWSVGYMPHLIPLPASTPKTKVLTRIIMVDVKRTAQAALEDAFENDAVIMERTTLEEFILEMNGQSGSYLLGTVVIFGSQFSSSLIPLRTIAKGAVLFLPITAYLLPEILDGYNAYGFSDANLQKIIPLLKDLLNNSDAVAELVSNGQDSARRMRAISVNYFHNMTTETGVDVLNLNGGTT